MFSQDVELLEKYILEVGVNSVKTLNLGNLFVDDNKIELIKTDYIAPLQKEINKWFKKKIMFNGIIFWPLGAVLQIMYKS